MSVMSVAARFKQIVEETKPERQRVRRLVADGLALEAEPDQERAAEYVSRQIKMNLPGREALVGPTNDLQAAWFLLRGVATRRAVAFIEVTTPQSSERGTGFLVSPQLFLTNQHVIPDAAAARGTQITFDNERDEFGRPAPATIFKLDPDRFALFSDEDELDYALIAVGQKIFGPTEITDLGFCVLSNSPDKHAIGMNINIIQHPSGLPKMIAIRNNILVHRTGRTLLYETDTDHGSSGAPVFNDAWELVALHHYGEPFLETVDDAGKPIPKSVNEGVRISAIYNDLEARLAGLPAPAQSLLRQALAHDLDKPANPAGRGLSPPRPGADAAEKMLSRGTTMTSSSDSQELRFTVPLEISVRVGGDMRAVASTGPSLLADRRLRGGAEALKIDEDYDNRKGYNKKFIPGMEVPLPAPVEKLEKNVAPLRVGEPAAEKGELKYQNFSLKLHKTRRMAIFSATNIDGETYLSVDRDTGEVSDGAEGDKWFFDPRVSESFYLNQSFYGEWSDFFDRGHLTRRTDPLWGTPEEAERANADTFHFTNATPQHFRFNQTAKFWQGAERFVLENGVLSGDSKARITVFQGPIFNSQIDLFADDVQIPSSFFKVIVWKGKKGFKSVGLIVDQGPLLSESRKNLGQPKSLPSVNVSQWRVPIASIEKRSGLSFGKAINDADTIKQSGQPVVGEALILVKSFDDLLPKTV
jgi:endonuclease G, mitochondrial